MNTVDLLGLVLGSPGLLDQYNPRLIWPFNLRGSTGNEDYTAWFEWRFPKTVAAAKDRISHRIHDIILLYCSMNLTMGPIERIPYDDILDVDINPKKDRFYPGGDGDEPQSWWEKVARIGDFEFKVESPVSVTWSITWPSIDTFKFSAIVYIEEQTGVRWNENFPVGAINAVFPLAEKRFVRMAEWQIFGEGTCCDEMRSPRSDWKYMLPYGPY